MKTADEIASDIEQFIESGASLDEVLKHLVRLLKREREYYNWVGIYLLEGDMLVLHNYLGKPTEHTRIPVGVGVCGIAVAVNRLGDFAVLDFIRFGALEDVFAGSDVDLATTE